MVISNENNSVQIRPTNVQGGAEMRANRRVLGVINQNQHFVVSKRGFAESNGIGEKNAQMASNRPVTRKYAAEMAVSQHPCQEEFKKPKTSSSSSSTEFTVWEDISLADAVPMSLDQSEVEIAEIFQIKEVEMEDISEETIVDIDGGDAKNPLAVVDYIEDLYAYYNKMERSSCVSPDYMSQQFDINERMRAILIDWLIEVHHKFELRDETLYLTVNIIDRFLEKQAVVRKTLQLVGLVALLLACKYEEVSVPVVDDLVYISDKAYTRKEVLEMERLMLSTLQFNMSVPTPYVFTRRFLKAAQSDKKLELVSFFLLELCQVEYEMLKYPPSLIAATAIYTAQSTLYGGGQWSKTCEWHTGYSENELLKCSRLVVGFHERARTGKLTGVHRKYSTNKYGYVARCEPAHFIVQTSSSSSP